MSGAEKSEHDFENHIQNYHEAIESNDNEAASTAIQSILAAASQLALNNPTVAMKLTILAKDLEDKREWEAASDVYQRILDLPDLDALAETQTHENLGILAQLQNRHAEALDHARRATIAARRSEVTTLISFAIQREARCLIRCNQIDEAIGQLDEALSILDDGRMYDSMRAGALASKANCAIKTGEFAQAESLLAEAFRLLEPDAKVTEAAGIQGNLATCWSVHARLETALEKHDVAPTSWRKAVEICRGAASMPHVEKTRANTILADMLEGLAEACSVVGLEAEREAALEERRNVLEQVGLPHYKTRV